APSRRQQAGHRPSRSRKMNYWLVMPAAGVGRRFGGDRPKQYALLCGRTVIEWALAPFLTDPRCAGAVVALAGEDPYWTAIAPPTVLVAPGGRERSHSVRNGLAALADRACRARTWTASSQTSPIIRSGASLPLRPPTP